MICKPQIRSHMLWCPCMVWVTRYNKFLMVLNSHWCDKCFKDVRANCFCAYLPRKFTPHVIHRCARKVIKWTMIGQHCLDFAILDLQWPLFFFDGSSSLPIYGMRNNEENLSTRSFTFLQNAVSNSVSFLAFRLSVRRFLMRLERLSFVKRW